MLRTVKFHGFIKEKYKIKSIDIDADTAYLVMQGLYTALGDEFKQDVRDGKWYIVRGEDIDEENNYLYEEQVHMLLGDAQELHLIPAIEGSGAVGRIIIGIVLIIVSFFLPPAAAFLAPTLLGMGVSMALGGVMELLSPTPKMGKALEAGPTPEERPSFVFNGAVNVMEQGGPVPLIYGHIGRCGSVVISAGIEAEAY